MDVKNRRRGGGVTVSFDRSEAALMRTGVNMLIGGKPIKVNGHEVTAEPGAVDGLRTRLEAYEKVWVERVDTPTGFPEDIGPQTANFSVTEARMLAGGLGKAGLHHSRAAEIARREHDSRRRSAEARKVSIAFHAASALMSHV